jgi:hypothetical protein
MGTDRLTNYDPAAVTFSFGGFDITGFNDGTFIDVERSEDGFTKHVGALGEVTRIRNLDRSGKITLTLKQTSSSNDILTAIYKDGERFGLTDIQTLHIEDHHGNMFVHAESAWIMKAPKIERAKGVMSVIWVFEAENIDMNPNGNVV